MAFVRGRLNQGAMAGAAGQISTYTPSDPRSVVESAGYFRDANLLLRHGEPLLVLYPNDAALYSISNPVGGDVQLVPSGPCPATPPARSWRCSAIPSRPTSIR
jgi:hypothetical protein